MIADHRGPDVAHACGLQSGLQGTNRPALYHVLLDENRFTPNDLQMLTYKCATAIARARNEVDMTFAVREPVFDRTHPR